MKKTVNLIFEKYDDLKLAYMISQDFKLWYNYQNRCKLIREITNNLYYW